jgi:hypothetical protein
MVAHVAARKRISGSKNFCSTSQKDFCNNIGQYLTHAVQQTAPHSITSSILRPLTATLAIGERRAHGMDRDCR